MKILLKRSLLLLISLAMIALTVPVVVTAEGEGWDGAADAEATYTGDGTSASPYLITTAAQLAYIANQVDNGTSYAGVYFRLGNDIDLNSKDWNPIGVFNNSKSFQGTFDGNNKTISNLMITAEKGSTGAAFFAETTNATVKNLTVTVDSITAEGSSSRAGGIIAQANTGTTVFNCHVIAKTTISSIAGANAGGVVGRTADGVQIIACTNAVDVTVFDSTTMYLGGIVGFVSGSSVLYCTNSGNVSTPETFTSAANIRIGGIVGYITTTLSTIAYCGNSGDVSIPTLSATSGKVNYAGGVVGDIAINNCVMIGCYNIGTISVKDAATNYALVMSTTEKYITFTNNAYLAANDVAAYAPVTDTAKVTETGTVAMTSIAFLYGETVKTTLGMTAAVEEGSTTTYASFYTFNTNALPTLKVEAVGEYYMNPGDAEGPWDGVGYASAFAGGDGTKDNPYQIATAPQLVLLQRTVDGSTATTGAYYELTADIDLNGHEWEPIGLYSTISFKGYFNGKGYTIKNLFISETDQGAALFGQTENATIENLNVSVVSVTGTSRAAAIVGQANAGSVITNCKVVAVDSNSFIAAPNAGGIVGRGANGLEIKDCSNACDIIGINNATMNVGGILGMSSGGTIKNCYNLATVASYNTNVSNSNAYIGGIVGFGASNATTIELCVNYGAVTLAAKQTANYIGGIMGFNRDKASTIANCANLGTVGATDNVDTTNVKIGTILGYAGHGGTVTAYECFIKNCGTADDICGGNPETATVTITNETLIDLKGWQTFEGDATQVRIIAGMGDGTGDVDLTAYDSVGFQIILLRKSDDAHGSYTTEPLTTVYTSVKAGDSTLSASSLNADYIVALTVTGLTDVADGYIFAITPYYTSNGLTDAVYCQTKTLTYVNAEDVISGN